MSLEIEQRLATLERQNRRLRTAFAAILAIAGTAAGLAALGLARREPAPKVIEAQCFNLVDATGKLRATLLINENGPRLRFEDENGKDRASIGYNNGVGPFLGMLDEAQEPRVQMAVVKEGSLIQFMDKGHIRRAELSNTKLGVTLLLADSAGKKRAVIDTSDDGPSMRLLDPAEKARLELVTLPDGAQLMLKNDDSKAYVGLVQRMESAGLEISEKDMNLRAFIGYAGAVSSVSVKGPNDSWATALVGTSSNGALRVEDDKHRTRWSLDARDAETNLVFLDTQKKVRIGMAYQGDQGSGLKIYNDDGDSTASLTSSAEGTGLVLGARTGKAHAAIGVRDNLPAVELYDEHGKARIVLQVREPWAHMILSDAAAVPRVLVAASTEQSQIILCDENFKTTWQAPLPLDTKGNGYLPAFLKESKPALLDPRSLEKAPDSGKLDLGPSKLSNEKPPR